MSPSAVQRPACSAPAPAAPPTRVRRTPPRTRWSRNTSTAQLELSPMNATAIGDARFDDRLDEATSPGYREKSLAHRARLPRSRAPHRCRAALAAWRASPGRSSSANANWRSRAQKFPEELMPLNQMAGLPMDLAVYGSGTGPQPFNDRARLRPLPRAAATVPALGRRRHRDDARGHLARHHPAAAGDGQGGAAAARDRHRDERRGQRLLGGRSQTCPTGIPAAGPAAHSPANIARALARKCCRPTRGSRISSSATIYPPRAPRVGWSDLPGRRGLVSLAHPRRHHHGHAAGTRSTRSGSPKWRASAARCSR